MAKDDDSLDSISRGVIGAIEEAGHRVDVIRVPGVSIELRAVPFDPPAEVQVVRCLDGDGPEETYRAAVALAEKCGLTVWE